MLYLFYIFIITFNLSYANYDRTCTVLESDSGCTNIQREKTSDGKLRFDPEGKNWGYGTRTLVYAHRACDSARNRGWLRSRVTETYTCKMYRYDNLPPEIEIKKETYTQTGSLLGYTGTVPCIDENLDRKADYFKNNCTKISNNTGDKKQDGEIYTGQDLEIYTGYISCSLINPMKDEYVNTYCIPLYEYIESHKYEAICKENRHTESGGIGDSGIKTPNHCFGQENCLIGQVVFTGNNINYNYKFSCTDKAGNTTERTIAGELKTTVQCQINGNCIVVTNSLLCEADDNTAPNTNGLKYYIGNRLITSPECTNQDVIIETECISDDKCGCKIGTVEFWQCSDGKIYPKNPPRGPTTLCTGTWTIYKGQKNYIEEDWKQRLFVYMNWSGFITVEDIKGNENMQFWNVNFIDKLKPQLNYLNFDKSSKAGDAVLKISVIDYIGTDSGDRINGGVCDEVDGKTISYEIHIKGTQDKILYGKLNRHGNIETIDLGLTKIGNYRITKILLKDKAGNILEISDFSKYGGNNITIYPSDISEANSTIQIVEQREQKYSNNVDSYTYKIVLRDKYGNPIYDIVNNKTKNIIEVNQDGQKKLFTDMVNKRGDNALIISLQNNGVINSNGEAFFKVRSLVPGKFTERFMIKVPRWNDNFDNIGENIIYLSTNNENGFKKPFVGEFKANTLDGNIRIGTIQEAQLLVKPKTNLNTYTIEQFKNNLKIVSNGHRLERVEDAKNLSNNPTISFRIEATSDSSVKSQPHLILDPHPIITYTINGKNVRWYLTYNDLPEDNTTIELKGQEGVFGALVIGQMQAVGKTSVVNDVYNYTDLSTSTLRSEIRKKAYELIKGMRSGEIRNGVKYVEGDFRIKGDQNYETLIVKNGNVIIEGNLNTSKKTLGIIVLYDNFMLEKNETKGNVYIIPSVDYINAAIYADGGIISADYSGNPYLKDSIERTKQLNKQIIIEGLIFTRNTIGGAVLGSSTYILPGGKITTDYDKAMMYDLNFLRRGNEGWDKNGNGYRDVNEYLNPVIIIFDSNYQLNPPKGFK